MRSTSPLFEAINNEKWDTVISLAKSNAEDARAYVMVTMDIFKYRLKLLPLHWACFKNSNNRVIEALLDSYPESARIPDSYFNRLPIHFACINEPDVDVVRTLLKAYPGGAQQK